MAITKRSRVTIGADGIRVKEVDDGDEGVILEGAKNNSGMSPYKLGGAAITANKTLVASDAGVHTVSGSVALEVVMPLAAGSAGVWMTIRSLSAHQHVLTASQESNGTLAINDPNLVSGSNGSQLALEAIVGSSVALMCDGVNWLVMSNSGSVTVSGT